MTLRVGDSFIADVNHYGEAAAYAADNGVYVIEDALGTLNHTSFGQAGTDYAYYHGVIINASEADEAAAHHNWPAAYEHTMVVNAIGDAGIDQAAIPNSFLHLLGCTNFGGYSFVSIPGVKCSSEAAGRSAGVSGLLVSAALNAIDRGDMTRYIRDDGSLASFPLSGEEMKQLWRLAADDIDFSSPCPDHAFCDEPPADVPVPVAPAEQLRDQHAGLDPLPERARLGLLHRLRPRERLSPGRASSGSRTTRRRAAASTSARARPTSAADAQLSAQDRIPPEADITAPRWWAQFPYRPDNSLLDPQDPGDADAIVIEGRAAANRVTAAGGTFGWVLEWAPHVQGQKYPLGSLQGAAGSEELSGGPWTTVASQSGLTSAVRRRARPDPGGDASRPRCSTNPNPFDPATDPTSEFQPERYAIRLRLRVIADPVESRRHDQQRSGDAEADRRVSRLRDGDPRRPRRGGEDRRRLGLAELPRSRRRRRRRAARVQRRRPDPRLHRRIERRGAARLAGHHVAVPRRARDRLQRLHERRHADATPTTRSSPARPASPTSTTTASSKSSSPISRAASTCSRPTAARAPASPCRSISSLSQQAPCTPATIPACDEYASSPVQDLHNKRDPGISSAPAIGDLDPAYPGLEIVAGSHDNHVYAWHHDGTPVPGWPVVLRDPTKVATMNPTTHNFTLAPGAGAVRDGTKVIVSPSLGDLDGDGDLEVVVGVNEQYAEDPNAALAPELLALGYLVVPGNARIYALHHDGAESPGDARAERHSAHARTRPTSRAGRCRSRSSRPTSCPTSAPAPTASRRSPTSTATAISRS